MTAMQGRVSCASSLADFSLQARHLMAQSARSGSVYDEPDWFELFARTVHDAQAGFDEYWAVHSDHASAAPPGLCRLALPVRRRQVSTLRGWQVEALGNYYTGLFRPAVDACAQVEDWTALFQAVACGRLAAHACADRLVLQPLPAEALPPLRAALHSAGFRWTEEVAFGNWYEDTSRGFDAYWQERPSVLRNTAARAARRFSREGGTLEVVTGHDSQALQRAEADYRDVYAQSWKPPEPYPAFMPGLIALAAKRGWLRLGIARLGPKPLAVHLWLVHAGRAEIYKLAYSEDAAKWSVGTLLGRHLMAHVITEDRVHEVDYGMGDEDYKRLWMSKRRERWRVDAVNLRTPRGGLMGLLRWLRSFTNHPRDRVQQVRSAEEGSPRE